MTMRCVAAHLRNKTIDHGTDAVAKILRRVLDIFLVSECCGSVRLLDEQPKSRRRKTGCL